MTPPQQEAVSLTTLSPQITLRISTLPYETIPQCSAGVSWIAN